MQLDLSQVPFSRYGSYMAFSHLPQSAGRAEGLYLRSVHGNPPHPETLNEVFRLEVLVDGQPVPFEEAASPAVLRLIAGPGSIELCMPEPDLVRVRGEGVGLRLSMPTGMLDNAICRYGNRWQITHHGLQVQYMLSLVAGNLSVDAPWHTDRSTHIVIDFLPDADSGIFEGAVEEFAAAWHPRDYTEPFAECRTGVEALFEARRRSLPAVPPEYAAAAELAGYITWSCVVNPLGHLNRPAMLMSRNWMNSLGSWDHCFNALALALEHPQLAWDQFMIVFDHQDAGGALPNSLNDRQIVWTFCKPPIHGWALRWLMRHTGVVDDDRLREVYEPLSRWTQWWFDTRDDDHDSIPQYNHGNDSGWDNATVFGVMPPVESPDLPAYLVVQMDTLSEIAARLGRPRESDTWKARASTLRQVMFTHSWRADHFIALRSGDHEVVANGDSLLLYLPLVLGERLPKNILGRLVAGLTAEGRFLTPHGLATESVGSPLYESDGYWRGPIWAPATLLIVDGLAAAGETALACDIARRFCDMAARTGMAENYDALTGEGLRDRAYTWSASVFLILAHTVLLEQSGEPQP